MPDLRFSLKTTVEFEGWYAGLSPTLRTRIDARLDRAKQGVFGDSRSLGGGLFEFKWKNGMRVYFTRRRIGNVDSIVVWGGFKDGQGADIRKARDLKARYEHELEKRL